MPPDGIPNNVTRAHAAAGALLFDTAGQGLLLVKPTYQDTWGIPGGFVDSGGETPHEACTRELHEELGLRLTPGELLVVDWAPTSRDGDKVLFVFDGGTLTADQLGSIRLPADELEAVELVRPEDVESRVIPRLARRVQQALAARDAGAIRYLEHGQPLDR